jgi:hypothetical protein
MPSAKPKPESRVTRLPEDVYERVRSIQARLKTQGLRVIPKAFRPKDDEPMTLGAVVGVGLDMLEKSLRGER